MSALRLLRPAATIFKGTIRSNPIHMTPTLQRAWHTRRNPTQLNPILSRRSLSSQPTRQKHHEGEIHSQPSSTRTNEDRWREQYEYNEGKDRDYASLKKQLKSTEWWGTINSLIIAFVAVVMWDGFRVRDQIHDSDRRAKDLERLERDLKSLESMGD